MHRGLSLFVVLLGLTNLGCASTWDTITSRRFRDAPLATLRGDEDAIEVLRADPTTVAAEARARAMQRLKEPLALGYDEAVQAEILQVLSTAVTEDPAPWVRLCAIDALNRFEDPRKVEILANAYHYAAGTPQAVSKEPSAELEAASANERLYFSRKNLDLASLFSKQGFTPEQISSIRCRAVDSIARLHSPEAVQFLARVAEGKEFGTNEDPTGKAYVRRRAVAGLSQIRKEESVLALHQVLKAELGRDTAMMNLAHEGLVELTGKKLPPDPAQWDEVIQAGYQVVPNTSPILRAIYQVIP